MSLSLDVGTDSLLCVAPGPREISSEGDLEQTQRLRLSPRSSIVCIDWLRFPPPCELGGPNLLSFARLGSYHSTSEVHYVTGADHSTTTKLTARDTLSYELGGSKWAALSLDLGAACSDVASVVVSGPRARGTADALRALAATTETSAHGGTLHELNVHKLASAGVLGASRVNVREVEGGGGEQPVLIARLATELGEDMYRLLALCLDPLKLQLGNLPYSDRLRASATQRSPCSATEPPHQVSSAPRMFPPLPHVQLPFFTPPSFARQPVFPPAPFPPPPAFQGPRSDRLPEPCC